MSDNANRLPRKPLDADMERLLRPDQFGVVDHQALMYDLPGVVAHLSDRMDIIEHKLDMLLAQLAKAAERD